MVPGESANNKEERLIINEEVCTRPEKKTEEKTPSSTIKGLQPLRGPTEHKKEGCAPQGGKRQKGAEEEKRPFSSARGCGLP